MAKNVAPNRCSNFDQISTPILTILELQNGTPNHSKISLRLMFELFRGARLLLLACCLSIAGALFLLRPLLRCSPSELPGYEAPVTKAMASWPRSLVAPCLRSSGGRRQEGVAP